MRIYYMQVLQSSFRHHTRTKESTKVLTAIAAMPQLFVQGQFLHTLDLSPGATVTALKTALASVEGVPAEQQVLTYGGVPLDDECVVTESVPELATLSVTVRVVGGQFHVR